MPTQDYTSAGSDTFTVPVGVTSLLVKCWGAGAGGQGGSGETIGQGGSGGDFAQATISVTPEDEIAVVVGFGGTSGAAGEDSYFGDGSEVRAIGGGSGNTTVGDVTFTGGFGEGTGLGTGGGGAGSEANGADGAAGGAGGSPDGGNGGTSVSNNVGGNGSPYGGGGGGGGWDPFPSDGGTGANGRVLIEWEEGGGGGAAFPVIGPGLVY